MALHVDENSRDFRRQPSERPMMLKDFLRNDTPSPSNLLSCKSTPESNIVLLRSWSKKVRISAIVKLVQFASFTRRKETAKVKVKVKVKDILRWRSFRDIVEEDSAPLDFSRSSWCSETTAVNNSKGGCLFDECDQKSPVSVLESPFRQDQDSILIPRSKCDLTLRIEEQSLEESNAIENKAKQLLRCLKEGNKFHENDDVALDFFMYELSINGKLHDDEFDNKILSIARSWIDDEWSVEKKRASYVEDMEKEACWNIFKQEQEDVSMELAFEVFDDVMHHLLIDFLVR